jgi:energy-coupling factor transport system ATP-binding protein
MHPKVLVLDEPTSALDPIAAEEVLSILHRLVHDLGLTVVVAEHKLERVIQFADRIVHIDGLGNTRVGTPAQIMSDSDIAPPIVHLARALGLEDVGLTVRDMRRMSEQIRGGNYSHTIEEIELASETVIKLSDVSLSFANRTVLKDIDLKISAGEVVALMGRNGAGKSSLLKTIVGLYECNTGSVSILGNNPLKISGAKRRETIGFIPQEPSDLLYGQSVLMECEQGDVDNEIKKGSTFELLNELVPGISPHTHPRDLSEGQRLALALSVVLSAKPKVLILDEPTRGLDYQAKSH